MADPNLSELVTTTLRNRQRELADNVTTHNPLFMRLKERNNIKLKDGGRTLVVPLEYNENGTFMWYSGYELLDVSPQTVISAAEYNWKQAAANVTISGLEQLQNAGKEQIIDLLSSRIDNAMHTMMNQISDAVFSDGTGSNSKEIGGLQLLVEDTGSSSSSTVGGIDRSSFSFWQNIAFDATDDGGAAATSANIQSYMNQTWVQLVRNRDVPDLIPADNTYWRLYLESLQAIQRITNEKMASAGFQNLKYMNADVFFDSSCPSNHMYMLNTKYLYLCVHRRRNMVPLENKTAINQDAMVVPVVFAGNLVMSNAALQGVLKD